MMSGVYQTQKNSAQTTIDPSEIGHFAKDSLHWWDEKGAFSPLHRLNPVRMTYIRDRICTHFKQGTETLKPLSGLKILDIGCGGGLASESLARMGAQVTGIDADENAIAVAQEHAKAAGLDIRYLSGDAADLRETFDAVLALEVIEHVSDTDLFMKICSERLDKNGIFIASTLNRSKKSYLLGIVAAEYILRWVPQGTHSWKKFIKPSEMAAIARRHALRMGDVRGLIFNPLRNSFELSQKDIDVNYLACFTR